MQAYLRPSSQSITLAVNAQCKVLEDSGKSVIRFGLGQSPFPPLPAAVEAIRAHATRKEYAPVPGVPELREAVASFHNALDKTSFTADRVFLGPGCKQLIFNIMFCFKELNVYIPSPAWVSYEPQARLIGHPFVRVQSDPVTHRMTPEALDAALSAPPLPNAPKLLIYNNPGNPDGQVDRVERLKQFAAVCKKHDVLVISDEIYSLLTYTGSHVCFATLYDKCIVTNGLSKWCGAGGWRIGAAMFNPGLDDLVKTFAGIASETYSCIPTPMQLGAVAAYQVTPQFHRYVLLQRTFLAAAGKWAARTLRDAGVTVNDPQGAFYLIVDFDPFAKEIKARTGLTTSPAFFSYLLDNIGVAMICGTAFGLPAKRLAGRCAFVAFDGAAVLKAMDLLESGRTVNEPFLREHAPQLVEGIERVASFAKDLRGASKAKL